MVLGPSAHSESLNRYETCRAIAGAQRSDERDKYERFALLREANSSANEDCFKGFTRGLVTLYEVDFCLNTPHLGANSMH